MSNLLATVRRGQLRSDRAGAARWREIRGLLRRAVGGAPGHFSFRHPDLHSDTGPVVTDG